MTRAALCGLAAAWLLAALPAESRELPRLLRLGAAPGPLSAAAVRASSEAGPGPAGVSRPPRREFPCDLYAVGAQRHLPGPLRLEAGPRRDLAAAAQARTLRLAIFRVDFLADGAGAATTTPDGRFDLRRGVSDYPVDPPPHDRAYFEAHGEALRRFYAAQSYGSLQIEATVFPEDAESAYHLSDTADYGPWQVSQAADIRANAEEFVTDAVRAVEAAGDVDFHAFDAFVVVHAGPDFQGDVNRDTPGDIPSFTLTFGESLLVNAGRPDSARVGRVLVLPEAVSQDERKAALNGVFAHEFGHILGLPDLYNIFNLVPQVGYWSLMDSGENIPALVEDAATGDVFEVEGILPTSLDPWSKLQVFPEVMNLLEVKESLAEALEAVEVNPSLPFVALDNSEYFLAENRALDLDGSDFPFVRQDSTTGVILGPVDAPDSLGLGGGGHLEYDAVLPGGGMLIWHINEKILLPALFSTGAVNFDVGLRGVAVEEADGIWDQGVSNLGRPEDTFCRPAAPSDLCFNGVFSPTSVPGSATDDGTWTGIEIETPSAPRRFMDVSIHRPLARDGWPVPVARTETVRATLGSAIPVNLDGQGTDEVAFGVSVVVAGEGSPRRGLAALHADGTGYELAEPPDPARPDNRIAVVRNALRPGLIAFNEFTLASGGPTAVVGTADVTSKPYLWSGDGDTLFTSLDLPAATVPPVIWDRTSGPDWVVTAGLGTVAALTAPPGTRVREVVSTLAPGQRAVAGPCLLPGQTGEAVDAWAAIGWAGGAGGAGGALEILPLAPDPAGVVAYWHGEVLSAQVRYVVGGYLGMGIDDGPVLAAVTVDSILLASPTRGVLARWALGAGETVALPPAVGDLDGDGRAELALATEAGTIFIFNGDGSTALGWPRHVPAPPKDLELLDLDGDGDLDVLVFDGRGRLQGLNGGGRTLDTYPRAVGTTEVLSAFTADLDGDGRLTWMATTEDSVLAVRLPGAALLAGDWRMARGGPLGRAFQPVPSGGPPVAGVPDFGPHDLLVHPNPARGGEVEIRFHLDDGESAALSVHDVTGRALETPRFDDRGGPRVGENAVRWDVDGVSPGLYLCRLERRSGAGSRVDMTKVLVLR